MKLASILAQYLYENKKLSLAGIGVFTLDVTLRTEADLKHTSQGISFQSNLSVTDDESLINYISVQTGKMKSLASSDLDSYLQLAKQFLNIGKPFHIEGIGTLVKNKSGSFEFTPGHLLSDKIKDAGIKELSATSISDESLTTYESLRPHQDTSPPYRKIFLFILLIATTGIIIYAGYRIYKSGSNNQVENKEETLQEKDTTQSILPSQTVPDTTYRIQETAGVISYRFVIEKAKKQRAFYRYDMLRKGGLPVQMSTDDSVTFKLFFIIPATAKDTAHIADSLTIYYPALNHKRAYAEY